MPLSLTFLHDLSHILFISSSILCLSTHSNLSLTFFFLPPFWPYSPFPYLLHCHTTICFGFPYFALYFTQQIKFLQFSLLVSLSLYFFLIAVSVFLYTVPLFVLPSVLDYFSHGSHFPTVIFFLSHICPEEG